MQKSRIKRILFNTFWLSLLLHLLVLLLFITLVNRPKKQQESPNHYVSSYLYQAPKTTTIQQSTIQQSALSPSTMQAKQESAKVESKMPELPRTQEAPKNYTNDTLRLPAPPKKVVTPQSIMAASREFLKENQRRSINALRNAAEPIYLVGEDNVVSDPLIKLIGRALSAHFEYPQMAGELGVTGRVIIGLTLHPEGHFSDVTMIRSSNSSDLDSAALYAVNQAPLVEGADRFLSEPKYFVVGFIFR